MKFDSKAKQQVFSDSNIVVRLDQLRHQLGMFVISAWSLLLLIGCGGGDSAKDNNGDGSKPGVPTANYAVGKITMEDGSPISGEVKDYMISIYGVSEAGEKVNYSPAVVNGRYKQKLVPGQFSFNPSKIQMQFGNDFFTYNLVPVGSNWNKHRDAAEGIVQDFIWKPIGQAETYGAPADQNNATHWHGMSLGMRFATYREDKKAAAVVPPDGSKLIFTLTPTSKGIDGKDLKPLVIERDWRPKNTTTNADLNDFMPGNYEITGICKLPDGSTKSIVFQGMGDYPNFVNKGKVPLMVDRLIGGMAKQLMSWGLE
jgi:hypothetical protein